jgi:hypothetical protein
MSLNRRDLLKGGAGLALGAGLAGCGVGNIDKGSKAETEKPIEKRIDGDLVYFNYSEYIDPALVKGFEKLYGVRVRESYFDSMSAMMAKLRAGIHYDVIFPSAEYVQRLRAGFLIRRIDRDKLGNVDTVYPYFDDPWYDPNSEHSTPYGMYATGLGYRADKVTGMTGSWRDLGEADSGDHEAGPIARLRGGVRYVRSRPDIVMLMLIMFFVGTFGMNFQINSALMATGVYAKGPTEYGILGSIMAIGTLAGALLAARRGVPRRRLVVVGAVLFGLILVVSGSMPTYELFAATLIPLGITSMTVLTAANSYIQVTVPRYIRGRVMSLYIMVLMGGTPLGAPLIGWIAQLLGPRWSLWAGGGVTVIATVVITAVMAGRNGFTLRPRFWPIPRIDVRPLDARPGS